MRQPAITFSCDKDEFPECKVGDFRDGEEPYFIAISFTGKDGMRDTAFYVDTPEQVRNFMDSVATACAEFLKKEVKSG